MYVIIFTTEVERDMNQILVTENINEKKEKNRKQISGEIDIEKIVAFFAIAIIVFKNP